MIQNSEIINDVIESTSSDVVTKTMRLSENANQMIFRMFIKNTYSNPIGTIVREITSNCFDSHAEAKVKKPILIKLKNDKLSDEYSISFIDFGVGLSPERMDSIYSVFFESTKRDTNDQIGNFGIGSKSPLAYFRVKKTQINDENGQPILDLDDNIQYNVVKDNSFNITTVYGGIKYYYIIREGNDAPIFDLIYFEPTSESNGTEIEIQIDKKDVSRFEEEVLNQLYYFEDIIYEGFNQYSKVKNDYKIYEGEHFLYRGNNDDRLHVSLGKVKYPLDFKVLGLNEYNYLVPFALKFNIGDISVTASRESLDYSSETIKIIKDKISLLKNEITSLINKQADNVKTLTNYFKFDKNKVVINSIQIDINKFININPNFKNYRYVQYFENGINKYLNNFLFSYQRFGLSDKNDNNREKFNGYSYEFFDLKNLYHSEFNNHENKKLKYVRSRHGYRFYILNKIQLTNSYIERLETKQYVILNNLNDVQILELLSNLQNEIWEFIKSTTINFDLIEVPKIERVKTVRQKPDKTALTYIPITTNFDISARELLIDKLNNKRINVIYGFRENKEELQLLAKIFKMLFLNIKIDSFIDSTKSKSNTYAFIQINKSSAKLIQNFDNCVHVNDVFNNTILKRKIEYIKSEYVKHVNSQKLSSTSLGLNNIILNKDYLMKPTIEYVKTKFSINYNNLLFSKYDIRNYLKGKLNLNDDNCLLSSKYYDILTKFNDSNKILFNCLDYTTYNNTKKIEMINLILKKCL